MFLSKYVQDLEYQYRVLSILSHGYEYLNEYLQKLLHLGGTALKIQIILGIFFNGKKCTGYVRSWYVCLYMATMTT